MVRKQHVFILITVVILLSLSLVGCGLQPESNSASDTNDQTSSRTNSSNNSDNSGIVLASYPVSELQQPAQVGPTPTPVSSDVLTNAYSIDELFINIYERVNPSVVNIDIVFDSSFSDSFSGSGSGFVYDDEGHIVTNAHVIQGAREIVVTFSSGYVTSANIVGVDAFSDLAVIKVDVDPDILVPVTMGNSRDVKVGQHVVVIGNPFGLTSSMTVGNVSATGRALPSEQLLSEDSNASGIFNNPAILQVDATINPGNSGGPVLNIDGELIGVAEAIRTETGFFQGVAFAIPSNTVQRIVPQLIDKGIVSYPYLGISSPATDDGITVAALAEPYNLPVSSGVLVAEVLSDSPAEEAGLRGGDTEEVIRGRRVILGGDIIVAINGEFVNDLDELLAYLIENVSPGETVQLTIVRDNQTLEIPVTVGERPSS